MRAAVEKILPGKLASHALAEGAKAISRYRASLAAGGESSGDDFGEDLPTDGEADLARQLARLRSLHVETPEQDEEEDF